MGRQPINPVIPDPWFGVQSVTSSGSVTLNYQNGRYVRLTLNAGTTLNLTGLPQSGYVGRFHIELYNTGAYSVTWPPSVIWAGGAAPIPTSGAGKKDIIIFHTTDGGTTIFGYTVGQDFF